MSAVRFLAYGWVDELFVPPEFHFKYWGFGWVPRCPRRRDLRALRGAGACWALLVAVGLFYRVAIALLFVVVHLRAAHRRHQLPEPLLPGQPAGGAAVLHAGAPRVLAGRAGGGPALRRATRCRRWCTYLLRFQVAVVYVFAGLAKLHGRLAAARAAAQHLAVGAHRACRSSGRCLDQPAVAYAAAWAGFLFDTTIVVLPVVAAHAAVRLRRGARLPRRDPAAVPHRDVPGDHDRRGAGLLRAVVAAAAGCAAGALAGGAATAPAPSLVAPPAPGPVGWRLALGAAALFVLVQLLLPLRTHLYGGNVLWHEQGMRFSWRVMVREKNGSVDLRRARSRARGREWHVPPAQYLTRLQEREMAVQPDLILQLAHRIAARLRGARARRRRGARRRAGVAERAPRRAADRSRTSIWRARRTGSAASAGSARRPPDRPPPHVRSAGARNPVT